ncbi:MAG: hypothetical protein IJJ92_09940 [Clostridia bacterium]|nr:hypothetical protein [Clostridia bacterium]
MKNRGTIRVLACDQDRERLAPVLDALRALGFRTKDLQNAPGKNDAVLAVLTEAFYSDPDKRKTVLDCVAAGVKTVIPFQLDGTPVPRDLKDVLYARNIISAEGRSAEQSAERIRTALPKRKSRLPLILGVAAVLLLIAAAVMIVRHGKGGEPPEVHEQEVIVLPPELGLTEEDLLKIVDVVIVGGRVVLLEEQELQTAMEEVRDMAGGDEEAPFIYFDVDQYAVLNENDREGGIRWYGMEDGQELSLTRYEDLRFIGRMPNLRYLTLALVDVPSDMLPDLSRAEKLEGVAVLSSTVDRLDWLSGSSVSEMMIRFTPVRDLSPLTACGNLRTLHLDMRETDGEADFSGFAPPGLKTASVWFAGFSNTRDLSAFSGLSALQKLQLMEPEGLASLSGLESLDLTELEIVNGTDLTDISALSSQKHLTSLNLDDCPPVRDYSPVAGCEALQDVMIYAGWDERLRDASFLSGLKDLKSIRLYSIDLPDLSFLETAGQSRQSLERLDFSGNVRDFSALSAVRHYGMLGIDLYGGSINSVLQGLKDAGVSYLYLRRVGNLDLSLLPAAEDRLMLIDCNIRDLSSIPDGWPARRVQLYDCRGLRSLNGIQNLAGFRTEGNGILEVYHCPDLTDWSALNGLKLDTLLVSNCYTLPSFENLRTGVLHLESIPDLTDLRFLDRMEASPFRSVELVGLDGLKNLEPLRRFSGDSLTVPPQLEEQARDLVADGIFKSCSVSYPQGGWNLDNDEYELQSLDELTSLPPALLRRVRRLFVAGGGPADPERFASLTREERDALGPGAIGDVSELSVLKGLTELALYHQPLSDLDGIQEFSELQVFRAEACEGLSDVSALFSLQGLTEICLRSVPVGSIQGIQNLHGLKTLDISDTGVTDLTVLTELPELQTVTVSADMKKAAASLDGKDIRFELLIEG